MIYAVVAMPSPGRGGPPGAHTANEERRRRHKGKQYCITTCGFRLGPQRCRSIIKPLLGIGLCQTSSSGDFLDKISSIRLIKVSRNCILSENTANLCGVLRVRRTRCGRGRKDKVFVSLMAVGRRCAIKNELCRFYYRGFYYQTPWWTAPIIY